VPGMADALPVCAILPKHGPVSLDRFAGAGGAALRPGGVIRAEAAHTGETPGAVWSAAGRGRATPGRSPLYTPDGRLCATVCVARAAEAANPAYPSNDSLAYRLPAAGALCRGRPALGRSNNAGISQSPGRSRPYRPHPGTVDLSP